MVFGVLQIAHAQPRPYIGYVYPAGGQQSTTFQIKLGGQGMDDVTGVIITGEGVSARVLEYNRVIGPQEITLLNEQLRELKASATQRKAKNAPAATKASSPETTNANTELITRIEKRIGEYVNRPASAALASILYAEVTITSNALPGNRELCVVTERGVSNPLVFCVGQFPEHRRNAMRTASYQVLGKEELALRKRPTNEVEARITIPCTLNGQVASGEQNRYRFSARKGQKLVIGTMARQLIPYIADAVPGWFQPVLALYDRKGREAAYDDDYRFKPDPMIFYTVPADGEYTLAIYDAIYRGREDFVYRINIGETPFVTSVFPLGARAGTAPAVQIKGWNLDNATITRPDTNAEPGDRFVSAKVNKLYSNRVPFAIGSLPECAEKEGNNSASLAQKIRLPIIVNGRIGWADDWDVFQFEGRGGDTVVAEVYARRLDSPLDSILKLTDASGKLLALNDDREDLASGINTHHADSYLMAKLPTNGAYFVHLGDAARNGGEEYGYRLRISAPQPDFALRVVPSSISLRSFNSAQVTVYAIRNDGLTNSIRLSLRNPPEGISATPVAITGTQTMARLTIKTALRSTPGPLTLTVVGTARVKDREIAHAAVPAEDRMQAFLWRHLVPAEELKVLVFDPAEQPPRRIAHLPPRSASTNATVTSTNSAVQPSSTNAPVGKPKFTKAQVAGRLRQMKLLFEEGLLTEDFYAGKVAECEAAR